MSVQRPLPVILCLHGAGTNATIFRLQSRMLLRKLSPYFSFHFVDAPFESLPGPGVLPTYADCAPYLWWHCDDSAAEDFDISRNEIRRRREVVRNMLEKELEDEQVIGIIAFSQGARVATGLCLDDKLVQQIRFVVLIAATWPVLSLRPADETQEADRMVLLPSVHVQGTKDPWRTEGTKLKEKYFQPDLAEVVNFSGGHTVPVGSRDVDELTAVVLRTWARVNA